MKIIRCLTVCLLIGFVFMLAGCRKSGLATNMVEGTVQWNGTPVVGALVTFQPLAGGKTAMSAFSTTNEQGEYRLTTAAGDYGKGTVAGRYKVLVTKIPEGARGRPSKTTELPGIYAETLTTPLEVEVVRGKNTFDFTLEGKAATHPVNK